MTNRTAKFLNVDSSCISAIRSEKSYDTFRQQAMLLSEEEKEKYILLFESIFDLSKNPPWTKQKTLDNQTTYEIMCVASTYGRGIETVILKHFNLKKGFLFHLMTGKGRENVKEKYKNTGKEEREKIGEEKFLEWNLQSYSKQKIKKEYRDLFIHYGLADLKQVKLRETPQSFNN